MKNTALAVLLLGCSTGFAQTLSGLCMLSEAHRTNQPDKVQLVLVGTDCGKSSENCTDMNNSNIAWNRWTGVSPEMLQKKGTDADGADERRAGRADVQRRRP